MDAILLAQARAFLQQGQVDGAIRALMPCMDPANAAPDALKLLVRLALRSGQMPLAAQALRTGLSRSPLDAELHALAASGAHLVGDAAGVERSARRALQVDCAEPLAAALLAERLGNALRISEGLEIADACLSRKPDEGEVLRARASLQLLAGSSADAADDATRSIHHSTSAQTIQLAALTQLYLDDRPAADTLVSHQALAKKIPPLAAAEARYVSRHSTLRIGLLSPDLRQHPVGQLIAPLLQGARNSLDLVCYHDGVSDQFTAGLRSFGNQWRDTLGRSDEEVARLLREDGVDVLLDLAGHTAGSRPRLLATRAAPFQFTYLGYLFDTGFDSCDGVIGDRWNLPEGTQSARRPLRLRHGFTAFVPDSGAPQIGQSRNIRGIRFGSFNHLAKLSPSTLRLWASVLRSVPQSTLVLCALGLADQGVRQRFLDVFLSYGVDPGRVDLRAPLFNRHAFLDQYREIDIALDPLPFNGGMTTLQALWQGVPVVTLAGERMAARTGASLLSRIGLDDAIASDDQSYVAIVREWADSPDRRRRFRLDARERMVESGITDAELLARDFAELISVACRG